MGFPRDPLNSADWLEIQNAVSNSDLSDRKRYRLLGKIETQLTIAQQREAAMKKEI